MSTKKERRNPMKKPEQTQGERIQNPAPSPLEALLPTTVPGFDRRSTTLLTHRELNTSEVFVAYGGPSGSTLLISIADLGRVVVARASWRRIDCDPRSGASHRFFAAIDRAAFAFAAWRRQGGCRAARRHGAERSRRARRHFREHRQVSSEDGVRAHRQGLSGVRAHRALLLLGDVRGGRSARGEPHDIGHFVMLELRAPEGCGEHPECHRDL